MSDQDPFHQETTRTTVVQPDPLAPGAGPVRTQETIVTDRQPNQTAWWIAGIVAVLAIIGGFAGQRWLLVPGATVLLIVIVSLPFRATNPGE